MTGINLYCPQHHQKEWLTTYQAEQLIYGLQAALADEECDPSGVFTGEDASAHLFDTCPKQQLRDFLDPEVYHEHIESFVDSRRTGTEARA